MVTIKETDDSPFADFKYGNILMNCHGTERESKQIKLILSSPVNYAEFLFIQEVKQQHRGATAAAGGSEI